MAGWPSELSPDVVAAIAAALRGDETLTTCAAAIDAGVSPGALAASLKRLRDGTGGEHVAPIQRALDAQCEALIKRADTRDDSDRPTSWLQWRLERKQPREYGSRQSLDVSGQLDTSSVQGKSDAELLAIIRGESDSSDGGT